MGSNSFGKLFTVTTWGESHGPAIGLVIDGCPAGLPIAIEEIDTALARRAPGRSCYTSPRREADRAELLSGLFEGETTGAPIAIMIRNSDVDSAHYCPLQQLLRPGHANYTYLEKYGLFDYRGGGRASARETACRVAAGAVAMKFIASHGISVMAYLQQVGSIGMELASTMPVREAVYASPLFCPDPIAEEAMRLELKAALSEGDSVGGVVAFVAEGLPVGLGDPVYEKLEAKLAHLLMGLPASKGFEVGSGFGAASMRGAEHNDLFVASSGGVATKTNHAGGLLGGITNGMPLYGRVAFKPTSSIAQPQETLNLQGESCSFALAPGARHDPCVAIRAVPVVEAMVACALADALLLNGMVKMKGCSS